MTTLSPLHFKDNQDFLNFISSFGPQVLKNSQGKFKVLKSDLLAEHFLLADDGAIYSWNSVKKYLEEALEKEIQEASVFFTSNHTKVTLAQLKSGQFKVEQLDKSWEILPFIGTFNTLFFKEELPSLKTIEDIKTGRIAFNTDDFSKMLNFSNSVSSCISSLSSSLLDSLIEEPTSYFMISMFKRKESDFINPIHKDLLKILITQQLKLKQYLLKVKEGKSPEEMAAINEWVAELDSLNAIVKNFLQLRIEYLKKYRGNFEKTEQEYQKLKGENWDVVKNQCFALNKQIKALSLQQQSYSVLRPLSLVLALGLIALPFIGLVVPLALFAPIFLRLALLVLPPLIIIAREAYKKINEKFDSLDFEKKYDLIDLKIKLLAYETKIEFFQKRELGNFSAPGFDDSLIHELEAEVVKIDKATPKTQSVNSPKSSTPAVVSSMGLFKTNNDEPAAVDDLVEVTNKP